MPSFDSNNDKAVEYFMRSADNGDEMASRHLVGLVLENKVSSRNFNSILGILLTQAETENEMESVGIPQLYLGLMLFHGPNGPEHLNDETAIQWFQRSREMDNYYAYFNLGYMYSHGYGAELDYEHAYECYMHAMMDSEARDPTNEVLLLKDDKVSSEIEAAFAELSKNGLTALLKEISNI